MIKELDPYRESIELLVRFVSGRLEGAELQAALETAEMQTLLGHFENPRYPARTNHYRRIQKQDRESIGGLLNSQGIIENFLTQAQVEHESSPRYRDAYSLILKSLPSYLDPPMEFILPLIPEEAEMSGAEKIKVLKARLQAAFPYATKPPAWIQSPNWPIHDGKPLVFIGQLPMDLPEFFHDKGMAYVFYSPDEGAFETIAQFC